MADPIECSGCHKHCVLAEDHFEWSGECGSGPSSSSKATADEKPRAVLPGEFDVEAFFRG